MENNVAQGVIDFVLDMREGALVKHLESLGCVVNKEALDVGDILFRRDGAPVLILERKTWSDLDGSITSKRHQQQRQRLVEFKALHNCPVGYVIEGSPAARVNLSRTRGAIENMVLKHGFLVFPSASVAMTCDMILSIVKKLSDGDVVINGTVSGKAEGAVEHVAGTMARKNAVSSCIFYHQLLIVPHVGEKMASTLAERFVSSFSFFQFISECGEGGGVKELADIKVPSSTGKGNGRRIGEKSAMRIIGAFRDGVLT